jgi:hypothetical protein
MTKKEEQLSATLSELHPGATYTLDEHQLGIYFPPGATSGILDDRTRNAAQTFAADHNCDFAFDRAKNEVTFTKRPAAKSG